MKKFDNVVEKIDDLYGSAKGRSGYVEVMGPDFDSAVEQLVKSFNKWRYGDATTFADIKPAQKEVVSYIEKRLKKGK